MNTENLFKLYYIAWHQRNKTREYAELGCLEKNLENYETILLKRNIDEYISNYVDSAYLDIWKKEPILFLMETIMNLAKP